MNTILSYSYPLTAPMVRPFTNWFRMSTPRTTMGDMTITIWENSCPHSIPIGVIKEAAITGRVCVFEPVKMRAYKNSFQEYRRQKIAVVASPGADKGSVIRQSTPTLPQPSMIAACSSSRGIVAKKLRINRRVKGRLNPM